jgi:hypothetical protein
MRIRRKHALETAGGIAQARHLLGEEPFLAFPATSVPHFDFKQVDVLHDKDMWAILIRPTSATSAWLYLVPNPDFHPDGDFGLTMYSLNNDGRTKWTFGNIGVYRMEMFDGIAPGSHANWARCCASTRTRSRSAAKSTRRMAQRRHRAAARPALNGSAAAAGRGNDATARPGARACWRRCCRRVAVLATAPEVPRNSDSDYPIATTAISTT